MSRTRTYAVGAVTALVVAGLGAATPSGAAPGPAPRAGTSVTLGQTTGSGSTCFPASATLVQHTTSASPAYETSTAGVITSYSFQAAVNTGTVRALAFTKTATNTFQLVGKSTPQSVTANVLNTFPTRIPVPAHALLGMQVSNLSVPCLLPAVSSGDEVKMGTFDADSSTTFTTTGTISSRVNISAVVESDADGDGYGDVTQDLCPTSATSYVACPAPDTKLKKAPKKKSTQRKAKITFSSSLAGSTFTCAVDKKAAKPCASPFKKKFKVGKHKVVITAISPAGIVDPTPVTVKFKVTKPRR
jgi:hypothetical protein